MPPDLDETSSKVRTALAQMLKAYQESQRGPHTTVEVA